MKIGRLRASKERELIFNTFVDLNGHAKRRENMSNV